MKNFLLFSITVLFCLSCEKSEPQEPEVIPTRYICEECISKSVIHDCDCSKEECQCNFDVSYEDLHKFDTEEDVVMLLVASVKVDSPDVENIYAIPDGYLAKYIDDDWIFGWHTERIEDFPYEKGYEYLIYVQREHYMVGDMGFIRYHYVETIFETKIQSYNLPKYADKY